MRNLFITLLAAITLFACSQPHTYTVTGTVAQAEFEGGKVLLRHTVEGEQITVDSTEVVDGKWSFAGTVEQPNHYSITITHPENPRSTISITVILERGDIVVTTNEERRSTVSGTKHNDLLQAFNDKLLAPSQRVNEIWASMREAQEAGNQEQVTLLREELNAVNEEMRNFRIEFAKTNINNPAGWTQLRGLMSLPLEDLKELIAGATRTTLQTEDVARVATRIEALERTAVGQPFVDLRMKDVNGNEIALSDFAGRGKYVMIDFTATWCGPCRVGKPAMIATYNKFRDKGVGFQIVGVWFDSSHEAWSTGMKALNMPDWPQMSDLRGWQSEGAQLYAITGIPHSVLICPEGIIIARSLRGDALDEKLAELLK